MVDQSGAGLVATWSGFAVFLALLLFSVQVLFNLWTASMVTAAAADAAHTVASDPTASARAEADFRKLLGGYASHVTAFEWRQPDDPDTVVLHVETRNPSFLLRAFLDTSNVLPFQHLDRTFRVRREAFR